jgi:hypothetical protein
MAALQDAPMSVAIDVPQQAGESDSEWAARKAKSGHRPLITYIYTPGDPTDADKLRRVAAARGIDVSPSVKIEV